MLIDLNGKIHIIKFKVITDLWTYARNQLIEIRNKYYPIVDIRKKPRKPLFLTIIIFISLGTAYWAINYSLDLFKNKVASNFSVGHQKLSH